MRASMSIPFFFEPVTFDALAADVDVPLPGGGSITTHYDPGTVTWVDGGMLRNFPIDAFAWMDGAPPRWPTIGIKLSSLQTSFGATKAATTAFHVARSCLGTMMNEWDAYNVDESTAGADHLRRQCRTQGNRFRPHDGAAEPTVPQRRRCRHGVRHRNGWARWRAAHRAGSRGHFSLPLPDATGSRYDDGNCTASACASSARRSAART